VLWRFYAVAFALYAGTPFVLQMASQFPVMFQLGTPLGRLLNRPPESCTTVAKNDGGYLDYPIGQIPPVEHP
jgi:hypothetical protein